MFYFISWKSFLTIMVAGVSGYYVIMVLALYRKEIANWIRSLSKSRSADTTDPPAASNPLNNLMGATEGVAQQSIRSSSVSAEELVTATDNLTPETIIAAESNEN